MIVLAMMAAVLSAPAQDGGTTTIVRGNPTAAPRTMALFMDNHHRRLLLEGDAGDRQRHREEVSRRRGSLAERLDRMITYGNCEGARDLVARTRYRDIEAEVVRVCDAGRDG